MSDRKYTTLIASLDEAAHRLTTRVLAEMYTNPFWTERFGDRATTHGRNDGLYHVSYVIQALVANDPEVLERYARWLQQVLTSRGMCTRHLAENFDRLAAAIDEEPWPERAAATAMLARATAALRYEGREAAALQEHAHAIATTATDALHARHPDWFERWGETSRARSVDDLDYHVQYLADAVALGTSTVFVQHMRWLGGFLEKRDVPRAVLRESLEALVPAIATHAPQASPAAGALISAATAALA